nr:glycosyltransferase family 2 protein [Paenibacillus xylanexedens]
MNPGLTILVCTINPNMCIRMLDSLLPFLSENDETIVLLDGSEYDPTRLLENHQKSSPNYVLSISETNVGLSFSRNRGMKLAKNDYVIFFDDDVVLVQNVLLHYKRLFAEGYNLVGGPLLLPSSYPPLPSWFPEGYSSLFSIHSPKQTKIWGANFGFDVKKANKINLEFSYELGRKGSDLASGDDTSFIRLYCQTYGEGFFSPDVAIEHYVDFKRYSLKYLSFRAYWQGRSEVRRNSIFQGLIKELNRAFTLGHFRLKDFLRVFGGVYLFSCVLYGVFTELLCVKRSKKVT